MTVDKPAKNFVVIGWMILFYPVGLLLMWKKTNWKKAIKITITVIYALWSFILYIAFTSGSKYSSADSSQASPTPIASPSQQHSPLVTPSPIPTPSPQVSQQMKDDFTSYYQKFMDIANKSDSINNKIVNDMQNSSTLGVAAVYLEVTDAQTSQDNLKIDTVGLSVPESLQKYAVDLNQSNLGLFQLTDDRSKAMKSAAAFLNTQDLQKLKEFRDSINQQQKDAIDSISGLVSVGIQLGVDTTKIQVNGN